jgi:hypothetical protein
MLQLIYVCNNNFCYRGKKGKGRDEITKGRRIDGRK